MQVLINNEVDNDDDASICVHIAFSGLKGTDVQCGHSASPAALSLSQPPV